MARMFFGKRQKHSFIREIRQIRTHS